jgi:opacity protein-like surface antigen
LRTLLTKSLLFLALLSMWATAARAQAKFTASRVGDLQVGAGYTTANSDYVPTRISGFTGYATFDFRDNFGAEFDFHQVSDPNSAVYERSYEWGGRYVRHYLNRRLAPYARVMYGRGVFNFPLNEANLAYNMADIAGGVDIAVHPRVNVRAEFEYQDWFSGPGITNGLTPTMFTIGAAYHFPPGNPH